MGTSEVKRVVIGVVGLGYVGLPVAVAFGRKYKGVVGFDLSSSRVEGLREGIDKNGDFSKDELSSSNVHYTTDPEDLRRCNFFVVAVPTPIDELKRPDLSPLIKASEILGGVISKGAVIVFESTVYPGVTEDDCGPVIEKYSGLKRGLDFKLGYSPERINPGDKAHRLENIVKVVSAEDDESLELVSSVYSSVIEAGVHRASSIRVAEAAKVIENTQRDLNIALMNELAVVFDRMGISSKEVFEAAGTKWNFLRFQPGLVGGHCIGVDPYYLTTKAEQLGYRPQVILSGRRINDSMGSFIGQKAIKLLIHRDKMVRGARIGIMGLTFKENVNDIRNSRVPDIVRELDEYGASVLVYDPFVSNDDSLHEFGINLSSEETFSNLDVIILAVSHQTFVDSGIRNITSRFRSTEGSFSGVLLDVKGVFYNTEMPDWLTYWAL
ncbi:MAG TPA: nucleotide sugar dehydrogenase [Oligoflexia bacterium]|nr:nucleotide sugar dehydrogenase [Oligoflexia bacterium]HMP47607.1 nucleotide sugar dehydrogenase [Oligoflexia bacterium]